MATNTTCPVLHYGGLCVVVASMKRLKGYATVDVGRSETAAHMFESERKQLDLSA